MRPAPLATLESLLGGAAAGKPGVSALDRALAAEGLVLGHDILGLQYRRPPLKTAGWEKRQPLVVGLPDGGSEKSLKSAQAAVARHYPKGHPVRVHRDGGAPFLYIEPLPAPRPRKAVSLPDLKGVPVLVTGGTGFIGSALVRRLKKDGARLCLLVRDPSKVRSPAARLLTGDIEDAASVSRAVAAARPEIVFSLAAVRDGAYEPRRDAAATLHLARALESWAGLKRWVRTGLRLTGDFGPASENALQELLTRRFALPVAVLRLFRVCDGSVPASSQGWQDLVHVDDVVDAYVRAALRAEASGAAFDIGGGRAWSPRQLAAAASGSRLPAAEGPAPEGACADLEPARRLLGWRPRWRPFGDAA